MAKQQTIPSSQSVVILTVISILWVWGALTTLFREGIFGWVMTDFLICLVAVVAFMSIMFLYGRSIKRYDVVDAAWGLSFIVIALTSFFLQQGPVLDLDVKLLVTIMVIVWGGRLAWHIGRRIRNSDSEDPRYVDLRKKWKGSVAINTYTRVYLTQAVLALFICVPVIHINLFFDMTSGIGGAVMTALVWLGFVTWLSGFIIEKTADDQLRTFLSNPENRGNLMTEGLWKYSRHPNYFGELTQWWGIFIICLATPFGWIGIIGPVLISYLILFVSGVPLSEQRFEGRKGWDAYKKKTSVLIPLPPRA